MEDDESDILYTSLPQISDPCYSVFWPSAWHDCSSCQEVELAESLS